MTQKDLDLEVADRLENLVRLLVNARDLRKLSVAEYQNYISAIRYAISSLRTEKNND